MKICTDYPYTLNKGSWRILPHLRWNFPWQHKTVSSHQLFYNKLHHRCLRSFVARNPSQQNPQMNVIKTLTRCKSRTPASAKLEVPTRTVDGYQLQVIDTKNPIQNPTKVPDHNCLQQTTVKLVENVNTWNI